VAQISIVMAKSITPETKQFRIAIMPGFIFVFIGGMSGALLLAFGLIIFNEGLTAIRWSTFLIAGALVTVFWGIPASFLWALMIKRFFPLSVSPDGICGHSFWGRQCFIRWPDFAVIRRFNLVNLPYLRIYSRTDKKVIWLPMFQSRPAEFREAILKVAPPASPILNHLN